MPFIRYVVLRLLVRHEHFLSRILLLSYGLFQPIGRSRTTTLRSTWGIL